MCKKLIVVVILQAFLWSGSGVVGEFEAAHLRPQGSVKMEDLIKSEVYQEAVGDFGVVLALAYVQKVAEVLEKEEGEVEVYDLWRERPPYETEEIKNLKFYDVDEIMVKLETLKMINVRQGLNLYNSSVMMADSSGEIRSLLYPGGEIYFFPAKADVIFKRIGRRYSYSSHSKDYFSRNSDRNYSVDYQAKENFEIVREINLINMDIIVIRYTDVSVRRSELFTLEEFQPIMPIVPETLKGAAIELSGKLFAELKEMILYIQKSTSSVEPKVLEKIINNSFYAAIHKVTLRGIYPEDVWRKSAYLLLKEGVLNKDINPLLRIDIFPWDLKVESLMLKMAKRIRADMGRFEKETAYSI